jgi:DNA invertase Pin-like site-specific DNA recombinase
MTTRAVIYARYSTDLQRDASIDDQIRTCKERIQRERWRLVSTYTDRRISGANHLRPGYQKLLEDARKHGFDVVVAEALDRLSRDQEHVAALFKQLTFAGVRIVTLAEGDITELHVGLKGTMNALFLKDLAVKTHRGLRGRIEAGRSAGGSAYGYAVVREVDSRGEPVRGGRRIDRQQAPVVVRVFRDYGAGVSPRAIAKGLNAEGVPGPRGQAWTASTIHGNRCRGTGLLNNEMYIGRLVWNRQHFVKDPETGKRQAKPNSPREWIAIEVPELRIIDDALWEQVKARQAALELGERSIKIRNALNTRHRPRHLLSGLLTCGACGAGFTVIGDGRYACANHVNRGTCDNRRTVSRVAIERRVLSGLKERLLAPELVAEFVREFHAQCNQEAREAEAAHSTIDRELADVERRLAQILAAIEQGVVTATTKERLLELESRRDALKAQLAYTRQRPTMPRLHPNLAEVYRRKVADLEVALNVPEDRPEAHAALRRLIDGIVLHPGAKRGEVTAEMHGEIVALWQLMGRKEKTRTSPEVRVSLVAGACNQRYLQLHEQWLGGFAATSGRYPVQPNS